MRAFKRALALLLSAALSLGATAYEGIDVSVWQGDIDFESVRASGKEVVYIRAGEDLFEDTNFRRNAQGASDAGLDYGFYFYVTAETTALAREQAQYFASLIDSYFYTCRPAVDYEYFGNLTDEEINEVALEFASTLQEECGVTPLFYTDAYNATRLWQSALAAYPLWIAQYGVSEPETLGVWSEWAGFQYSDRGSVGGIAANVDLDVFTDAVFLTREEEINIGRLPFSDVTRSDWFYTNVLDALRANLMLGVSEELFAPRVPASRAMAAQVIYRESGADEDACDENATWYCEGVTWVLENRIALGYPNGEFYPMRDVTRQELAVMYYRYAEFRGDDISASGDLSAYSDASSVAPWARSAMIWAVDRGLIRGVSETRLEPSGSASRAQLAAVAVRFNALNA